MPLSDVSLLITAGHRPLHLAACLKGISEYLPECTTVVVTDDESRIVRQSRNVFITPKNTIWCPVPDDTFLTAKRNRGVELIDTQYTVMLADDFVIDVSARRTVIRMMEIMQRHTDIDVLGGTYKGKAYEGFLKVVEGRYIQEIAGGIPICDNIWKLDIVANFFIARTHVLKQIPWDETIGPIGGEHADWFLDLKAAHRTVAWAHGLNIEEQPRTGESEEYNRRRRRALDTGHKLMLEKRGVKQYYGFGETP